MWHLGILVMLLTVATLAGCQSAGDRPAGQRINDVSITAAVQSKLTGDRTSNFARVDVETEAGVVRLSGIVLSADQRKRAEELARQVHGVVRVDNHLQIQNQPIKTGRLHD
jgi:hyperosmotically inducible protein